MLANRYRSLAIAGILSISGLSCAGAATLDAAGYVTHSSTVAPNGHGHAVKRVCMKRSKLGHCEHWRKSVIAAPRAVTTVPAHH